MAAKYVLKKSINGQYMFNLHAGNGGIILTSEMYASRYNAEAGIGSVQKNSANEGNYERKMAGGGQPYFILKAANGQVIGRSEMYSSAQARDRGIEAVKANGSTSQIVDNT